MATESVDGHFIDSEDVHQIRWMLLDGIKAKAELERLKDNIEAAAAEGWTAKSLKAVMPKPVDLDVVEAAEMVQVLSILPTGRRV